MTKRKKNRPQPPPFETSLMRRVARLSGINPVNYGVTELCLGIGQREQLSVLVPLALEIVRHHPLAEGDTYPGELLDRLLYADRKYWRDHPDQATTLRQILSSLDINDEDFSRDTRQKIACWLS